MRNLRANLFAELLVLIENVKKCRVFAAFSTKLGRAIWVG